MLAGNFWIKFLVYFTYGCVYSNGDRWKLSSVIYYLKISFFVLFHHLFAHWFILILDTDSYACRTENYLLYHLILYTL